jgi:ketosteroid isomerase-like protein
MVWTVTGHSPAGGTTTGMDGVMRNFGDIMAWTNGTYDAAPVDYLGSDDHVVALAHVTARRADGRTIDVPEAVVFRVRDGRLVAAQHMAYDEQAWDAFFEGMPTWKAAAPVA